MSDEKKIPTSVNVGAGNVGNTFLGSESDRTNPNRLNGGIMSTADKGSNAVPVIERPSALKTIQENAKPVLIALVIACAGVLGLAEEGLFVLPVWLKVIIGIVLLVGAAFGIRPKKNKDGSVVIAGSPEDSNVIKAKADDTLK